MKCKTSKNEPFTANITFTTDAENFETEADFVYISDRNMRALHSLLFEIYNDIIKHDIEVE